MWVSRLRIPIACALVAAVLVPVATAQSPPERGKTQASEPAANNARRPPPPPLPEFKGRNPRVLFIVTDDCAECVEELERLRADDGPFARLRQQDWKIGPEEHNDLQIVQSTDVPLLVQQLRVTKFPTVACLQNGRVVRSFTDGCRTPLDEWTFGWLLSGYDERDEPALPEDVKVAWTGTYPLRGNHWSVEGDWIPSFEKLVKHMRGENHLKQVPLTWPIETWSYEEIRSLHDDVHENDYPKEPLKSGYRMPQRPADESSQNASVAPPVPNRQGVPRRRPGRRVRRRLGQ